MYEGGDCWEDEAHCVIVVREFESVGDEHCVENGRCGRWEELVEECGDCLLAFIGEEWP